MHDMTLVELPFDLNSASLFLFIYLNDFLVTSKLVDFKKRARLIFYFSFYMHISTVCVCVCGGGGVHRV